MRVVTWNVRRATPTSRCWDYIQTVSPDLALLQEVGGVPESIFREYANVAITPNNRNDQPQPFKTLILVRGSISQIIPLKSAVQWVNNEYEFFKGNILAYSVKLISGLSLNVVSVYSPAWPVNRTRLSGIDVTGVKLLQNDDIWCTEILWSLIANSLHHNANPWIVGGDFNSSETFDARRKGGRGNLEIIQRFNALGLYDTLRKHQGALMPTFRNPRGGKIVHQIDHLYVSDELLTRLLHCATPPAHLIFGAGLSDHLPIIAEFDESKLADREIGGC